MRVRQSDLKTWARCPLQYKYQHIDHLPREQSGALTFGTIIHDCVLYMETHQDPVGAIARFYTHWMEPELLDPELTIDYYVSGTSWKKYAAEGERILRDWWQIIQWESDVVLGREYTFDVPVGDGHVLHGTIDKLALRYDAKLDSQVVLISDYKTNAKDPTYGWLADDLQFTAYAYATTRPEFWANLPDGEQLFEHVSDLPRQGEWVALKGPKRLDAGLRNETHYNRLIYAINAMCDSVSMRIFVPNISGESCRYCDYRKNCGLEPIE